jgi:hypothetical protein
MKYQELKRLGEKDQEAKERLNSAVYKAKLFGDALVYNSPYALESN